MGKYLMPGTPLAGERTPEEIRKIDGAEVTVLDRMGINRRQRPPLQTAPGPFDSIVRNSGVKDN